MHAQILSLTLLQIKRLDVLAEGELSVRFLLQGSVLDPEFAAAK